MFNQRKYRIMTVEVVAVLVTITAIAIPFLFYSQLPETIPNHFGFSGKPNGFGEKKTIWLLPVMAGIIYLVLTFLNMLLAMLKRPDEVTTEVLGLVQGMIRSLKILFSFLNLYLVAGTVRISLGIAESMGWMFTPVFLLAVALIIIVNIVLIFRKQKEESRKAAS